MTRSLVERLTDLGEEAIEEAEAQDRAADLAQGAEKAIALSERDRLTARGGAFLEAARMVLEVATGEEA